VLPGGRGAPRDGSGRGARDGDMIDWIDDLPVT
jgi:hypothetical protein